MADNVQLDSGSGGLVLAADDISSVFYQRMKLIHGSDGTNDGDVSTANPLPVDARELGGVAINLNTGTRASGTQRVTIATDDIVPVVGTVAHDGVDAGNPQKIGAKAVDVGATPTAVAAADRTDLLATRAGQLFVIGGHPNIVTAAVLVLDSDGAQTDALLTPAIAAGTAVVVTSVSITCDGSNSGNVNCAIGFGTANVPTPALSVVTGLIADFKGCPAGGGMTRGDGSGIIGIGATNEEVRYTCEDPAGGNLTIMITYYTIAI